MPGHEVVGQVTVAGDKTSGFQIGDIVGAPWLVILVENGGSAGQRVKTYVKKEQLFLIEKHDGSAFRLILISSRCKSCENMTGIIF